jgi:hypothetical protein
MKTLKLGLVACALTTACAGGPSAPLGSGTAALHLTIDGATCRGLGSVSVFIDGTNVGTVQPGDSGVSRDVVVGQHNVSAQTLARDYGWTPSIISVTRAGFQFVFSCP